MTLFKRVLRLSARMAAILSAVSVLATSAHGAAGDDPASVIATRTAPGETTAFVCGAGGFVIVQFFLGAALVSEIESGTTCTPGAPLGSGLPVDDAIEYVDDNLDDFFPVLFDGDLLGDFSIPSFPDVDGVLLAGGVGPGGAGIPAGPAANPGPAKDPAAGPGKFGDPDGPSFACLKCRDELAQLEARLENAKALRDFIEKRIAGLQAGNRETIEQAGLGSDDVEQSVREGIDEAIAGLIEQRNVAVADLNRLRFDPGFFFPTLFPKQIAGGITGTEQGEDREAGDIDAIVANSGTTNGDNTGVKLEDGTIDGAAEAFGSINVGGDSPKNIDDRIADAALTFHNALGQAQAQQGELDRQEAVALGAISDAIVGKLEGKAEDVALDVAKKGGRATVVALTGPASPAAAAAFNVAFNVGVAFEEEITSGRIIGVLSDEQLAEIEKSGGGFFTRAGTRVVTAVKSVGSVAVNAAQSTIEDGSELADQTAAILFVPLLSDASQEEQRLFGVAAVQLKKVELLTRLRNINQRITELRNLTDAEIEDLTRTAQQQAIDAAIAEDKARLAAFGADIQALEAEIAAKKAECDRICPDDKNAALGRSARFTFADNGPAAGGTIRGMRIVTAGNMIRGDFDLRRHRAQRSSGGQNGAGGSILDNPRLNVFVSSEIGLSNDDRVAGLDGSAFSIAAGASWLLDETLNVGVAARFHHSDVSGASQNLKGEAWSIALFAQTRLPWEVGLNGAVAYGRSNIDGTFNNLGTITTADIDANVFSAQLEASRAFDVSGFSVVPSLGLTFNRSERGAFLLSDGQFAPGNDDVTLFLRGAVGVSKTTALQGGFLLTTSAGLGGFSELTDGRSGASLSGGIGLTGPDGMQATLSLGLSGPSDDQLSGTGSLRLVLPLD